MIAYTTAALPEASPLLPDRVSVGRPDDADGIRVLSDWARVQVWPAITLPPWSAPAGAVQLWACQWAHQRDWDIPSDSPEYAHGAAVQVIRHLATTAAAARVEGPDEPLPNGQWDAVWPIALHDADGYPVVPLSWEYMHTATDTWGLREPGHGADPSADLWRWCAADRAEVTGTKSGRDREQVMAAALPNALRTAQAMHDALTLLLPQAQPPEPTEPPPPTYRRNSWA